MVYDITTRVSMTGKKEGERAVKARCQGLQVCVIIPSPLVALLHRYK
jgi:hypothetical protein